MKKIYTLLFSALTSFAFSQTVFINEIHYDNSGSDLNEGIEVAGPANTDLSNYSLVAYNGSSSETYKTITLSGIISDEQNGYGAIWFSILGLQNGAPDAIALIKNTTVIQFLSYEGTITASNGPANGMTSNDIGVFETNQSLGSESLQLSGSGTIYSDFTWQNPVSSTNDSINNNQTFDTGTAFTETLTKNNFQIYPNPVINGFVTIKTTSNEVVSVSVFNILGKQVINTTLNNNTLDVSNLKTGVYILRLSQNGNTTTKKLVIN